MKLKFEMPGRFEWGLFILAGLLLILFDWTQNAFQTHKDLYVHVLGVPAIYMFWGIFVAYHAILFTAYARAIIDRGTHYKLDWAFGSLLFIGMFFLLVGGIGAMYFSAEEGLPFFFNLAQISVYHFGGIAVEIIGLSYFIVTD